VTGDDPRPETPTPSRQLRTAIQTRPARAVTDDWDWQILAACRGMDVESSTTPLVNAAAKSPSASPRPKPSAGPAPSSPNAPPGPCEPGNPTASGAGCPKTNEPPSSASDNPRYPRTQRTRTKPAPAATQPLPTR